MIKQLFTLSLKEMVLRFPFSIIMALTTAITTTYLTLEAPEKNAAWYSAICLTAIIGVMLFTALALYAQRKGIIGTQYYLIQAIGIIPLVGFYVTALPADINVMFQSSIMILFFMLLCASFALVMLAPYIHSNDQIAFWQFNKWLLLRMFLSAFSGGVLFVAFALALFSIDTLFHVEVDGDYYFILWQWIVFVFGTVFVLLGMKKQLKEHDNDKVFPEIIRKFCFNILSPILVVYFLIVYAYVGKILFIEQQLPEGGVAMPTIIYSSVVIIALLLTYPWYLKEKKHSAARTLFYIFLSLIPALIMYFVALGVRVHEYGITITRYIGIMVGVWFAYIVLYSLARKFKNIKTIFIAVAVLLVITSYGPWSVFNVSEQSQSKHFIEVLQQNNLIINNTFSQKAFEQMDIEDQEEVRSIARYLADNHSFNRVRTYFTYIPNHTPTDNDILELLTINDYFGIPKSVRVFGFHSFGGMKQIDISAYDEMVQFTHATGEKPLEIYVADDVIIQSDEMGVLTITYKDKIITYKAYDLFLSLLQGEIADQQEPIQLTFKNEAMSAMFIINSISGQISADRVRNVSMEGLLLLHIN